MDKCYFLGIQVYNSPCGNKISSENETVQHATQISLEQVVSIVVSQFRDLIGVSSDHVRYNKSA